MADIQCAVSTDKQYVKIVLVDDDGSDIGEHLMAAADLDTFIQEIGRIRATMTPPVTRTLDPNPAFTNVTREPVFHVNRQHILSKEFFIAARHPGFGWLAFVLEAEAGKALAGLMQRQIDAGSPKIIIGSGLVT